MIKHLIKISESHLCPDFLIRFGIRQLLRSRIASLISQGTENDNQKKMDFIEAMNSSPIALVPELANEQHYEVPSKFYDFCLGEHKKYSSCYWNDKAKI